MKFLGFYIALSDLKEYNEEHQGAKHDYSDIRAREAAFKWLVF